MSHADYMNQVSYKSALEQIARLAREASSAPEDAARIREALGEIAENALGVVAKVVPLEPGQYWRNTRGPWPSRKPSVRILDVADGWVRYYVNDYLPDERETEEIFRGAFNQRDLLAEERMANIESEP